MAITDLKTEVEFAMWATQMINKIQDICLPSYKVTISKGQNNPQEECKSPQGLNETRQQSFIQFTDLVTEIETELQSQNIKL